MRTDAICRLLLQLLVILPLGVLAAKDKKKDKGAKNVTIDRLVNLRTHSIYAPYIDQDLQNRWWDFGADAIVNTNKHIRLTRNKPSQMGWLWSRLPLTATHYVIEVEFKMSTEGKSHLFGDGMAIWLTKTRAQPGPVFGSVDKFTGLGIFLDTYANSRHAYSFPRVVAMMGDGETNYDYEQDGERTNIGACSANFRKTNVPTKVKITYAKDTSLDVKVQYKAHDQWEDCIHIDDISIPLASYLGFSALTGDVFEAHDIISVTTSSAILADPERPRDKFKTSSSTSSGSWFGFFIKSFLFIGVCVGALYGYQEYTRRNSGFGGSSFGRRGGIDVFSSAKRF
ncbi:uncharacterized protein FOMMEDRAFT_164846 [Fomitiporia mediterranea MF3/22]|uniref:uncharacterized protein n=1 Tax=Fomitiporia mediterranea (strain MF3/22) TaxID=694068 RepID=UPI00044097B2|nr:uncharacterized protein FOMMEDRAFT_164846 [Fomitiporia mediterranea MF3/22]EJD08106.1 hypothetical protein FOMMEDRAFT_164846 [Fomitiporia mediterranea MF3/22]